MDGRDRLEIDTARLRLRPVCAADVPAVHAILVEPDVRRYLCDGEVVGREWVRGVVADSESSFARVGLGLWAACRRGESEPIGFVGYREFFDPPVLELLYALGTAHWGRGLATDMARAATERGFAEGLAVVRATTDAPNLASIRVMERLGMTLRGREPADPPNTRWEQLHFAVDRPA